MISQFKSPFCGLFFFLLSILYCYDMLTNMQLVSVIIPSYNRAAMVAEAVESVLAQTYHNIELIIIDDGSEDETPDILAPYFSRLRYIAQPRQGPSAARNTGIVESHGVLIAFLDSDDLWLPEKIARQVDYFQSDESAMICQTEEIWRRGQKIIKPRHWHRKESGWIFNRSVELCLISPSAVMMRRELFEHIGMFDETLPAAEDYDLWLRITWQYPVGLIEEPLVIKRGGHADQLSSASVGKLDKYRIQALVKLLRHQPLSRENYETALSELRRKCEIYALGCSKYGRDDEAAMYRSLPDTFS